MNKVCMHWRVALWLTWACAGLAWPAAAQEIYLSALNGRLYRLNLADCSYTVATNLPPSTTDISFHPNGNLYVISSQGRLTQLDPVTGAVGFVHQFGGSQFFTALTADANGRLYAAGQSGLLYSYQPATGQEVLHGNMGYPAAGDLTFFDGQLYMASTSDDIILVDIDNPANSSVAINGNVAGEIFGIVSYAENCSSVQTYALTNNNARIYLIDFATNQLTFFCELNLAVGGGASTFEFYASEPISLTEVIPTGFNCTSPTGSLTLVAEGGVGQLAYSLDGQNFQAGNQFTNLPVGAYTAYVRDQNGCTAVVELTLGFDLPTPAATVQPASCGLPNASLLASAADGTPPYAYSLDGLNFQTSPAFNNLAPGSYVLYARDAEGCIGSAPVVVGATQGAVFDNLSATPTRCGEANGALTAAASTDTPPLQYSLDGLAFQEAPRFDNLAPGMYTVTVRDDAGCLATLQAEVAASLAPLIVAVDTVGPRCGRPDGRLTVSAAGDPPLQYALNNNPLGGNPSFGGLAAGAYQVRVLDGNGCPTSLDVVLGAGYPPPGLAVQEVTAADCGAPNGALSLAINGGLPPFLLWLNDQEIAPNPTLANLTAGAYRVRVLDQDGCTDSLDVRIPSGLCRVYLPNAFSPNSDGVNDRWQVFGPDGVPTFIQRLQIFDRWGGLVFEARNLPHTDSGAAWDGQVHGQAAAAGQYVYLLEVVFPGEPAQLWRGGLVLVR